LYQQGSSSRRKKTVRVNRIVHKRVRRSGDGVNVVGDVNVAVTGSVGEGGTFSSRTVSRQRIEQRSVKKTGRDTGLESNGDG